MNRKEENYVRMARAVQETLNEHSGLWATMSRFVTAKELLDTQIAEVDTLNANSKIQPEGATDQKLDTEDKAARLAVKLSDRAQAYAQDINDLVLWKQLEVSYTDLTHGADANTLALLTQIYNQLETVSSEITAYGVSKEELAILKNLIQDVEKEIDQTRHLIVKRKGYHTTIPLVLRDMRSNFRILDRLINIWEGSELERQYWDARIVIDLRGPKDEPAAPTPEV